MVHWWKSTTLYHVYSQNEINFFEYGCFLAKNISDLVSLSLKLNNQYYYNQPTEKIAADRFNLTGLNPDLNLSDNAKDFKKLFETFQKTNSPSSHSMMEWVLLKKQVT